MAFICQGSQIAAFYQLKDRDAGLGILMSCTHSAMRRKTLLTVLQPVFYSNYVAAINQFWCRLEKHMPRILRFGFIIGWKGRNFIKGLINIPSEDVAPQKLLMTLRNFKCIVNTPSAPFHQPPSGLVLYMLYITIFLDSWPLTKCRFTFDTCSRRSVLCSFIWYPWFCSPWQLF